MEERRALQGTAPLHVLPWAVPGGLGVATGRPAIHRTAPVRPAVRTAAMPAVPAVQLRPVETHAATTS